MKHQNLIDRLEARRSLEKQEWEQLLTHYDEEDQAYAASKARATALSKFGKKIYIRGLIEISNYCKNNCFYCGIRKSNQKADRYRLTREEILSCCQWGYGQGFRTFVLQGGEDPYFNDERVVDLVHEIKARFPDCALTLSLGEKERESYQAYFDAGADRYLLRHETACEQHYAKLHPPELSLSCRKQCLRDLLAIGYQTGCGFMVGSPYQTAGNLAEDLLLIKELNPQMVGIGPFIPHKDTPLRDFEAGTLRDTLFLLSLVRLMLPKVLLPATTALGTICEGGREQGVLAGANVYMPNLSPPEVRQKYMLYDNKVGSKEDAQESVKKMAGRIAAIGYELAVDRGDYSWEA